MTHDIQRSFLFSLLIPHVHETVPMINFINQAAVARKNCVKCSYSFRKSDVCLRGNSELNFLMIVRRGHDFQNTSGLFNYFLLSSCINNAFNGLLFLEMIRRSSNQIKFYCEHVGKFYCRLVVPAGLLDLLKAADWAVGRELILIILLY